MHIPNGMLHGAVCPVTAAVSAMGLVVAAYYAVRSTQKPTAFRFASVTAFIFAAQMVNFQILNGTSGHLLGGVLAASLLGIPFGILSMALVLTVQCLVFADGGVSALGANILNMAIIGAGFGGWMASRSERPVAGIARGSFLAVVAAAAMCSIELAVSGAIALNKVMPIMLFVHAIIGVVEGILTVVLWRVFSKVQESAGAIRATSITAMAAMVVALVLSPFASSLPDGLEWVAQQYKFFHESAPTFVTPLADYSVASMGQGMLAGSVAGAIGVILTFALGWVAARCLRTA